MIKKIFKKIIKFLYLKFLSQKMKFELELRENEQIKDFKKFNDHYFVRLENINLVVRNHFHSDFNVFRQIFTLKEYDVVVNLIRLNFGNSSCHTIIDAGANVGYTSLFFLDNIKNAKVFAIEPFNTNMLFLKKNIEINKLESKIVCYENALSHVENCFYKIDDSFRDGMDWSISTVKAVDGKIKGITINEIIENNQIEHVSILKIDIEGAERYIFQKGNNLEFLKLTKVIAIEIHDEFKIREEINSILIENSFIILESGELTLGINKNYIS